MLPSCPTAPRRCYAGRFASAGSFASAGTASGD
jgi:hypothetical protein